MEGNDSTKDTTGENNDIIKALWSLVFPVC